MENQTPTFVQSLKAGAITGVASAVLNIIWNMVAQSLGSVPPPDFTMAVIMASIVPLLLGSVVYFLLVKYTAKGKLIFWIVGGAFLLFSFGGPMQPQLPDGSPTPEGFALLTIPMHAIAGLLALWGIPRFAR